MVQAGTSGIGLAVAKRLATDGFAVVVSSRREANVNIAVQEIREVTKNGTVTGVIGNANKDADRKLLAEVACSLRSDGKIHALVCNAGASTSFGPLLETSEQQFAKMLETNLLGTFLTVKEFSRRGSFAHDSGIVIVTSIGAFNPLPALGAYSITKTALVALCKVLAKEMGATENRTRVNCVAPGIIRTKFSEMLWKPLENGSQDVSTSPDLKHTGMDVPLGRLGAPEDVSGVVAFLLSEDARYVTGETLVASGGMHSRL